MEEADFLLDRGQQLEYSLKLAQAQQARRPGHLHANETLAWALLKNGQPRKAVPYIERAMRLGTGDAMVHFRAAQIYRAAGDRTQAARHLRLALDANLDVESPSSAAEARQLVASMGTGPTRRSPSARTRGSGPCPRERTRTNPPIPSHVGARGGGHGVRARRATS